MSQAKKKDGRPRTEINIDQLSKLASMFCTAEDCAEFFDCSVDTLNRRLKEAGEGTFAEFYKRHKAVGRISLRRAQMAKALSGHAGMLIWMGKQELGQRDNLEITGDNKGPIKTVADDATLEEAARLYQETLDDPLALAADDDESELASKLH